MEPLDLQAEYFADVRVCWARMGLNSEFDSSFGSSLWAVFFATTFIGSAIIALLMILMKKSIPKEGEKEQTPDLSSQIDNIVNLEWLMDANPELLGTVNEEVLKMFEKCFGQTMTGEGDNNNEGEEIVSNEQETKH
ncbi:hypothetical protein ACOME3_001205 [Neoechinorhynchus agilis]